MDLCESLYQEEPNRVVVKEPNTSGALDQALDAAARCQLW
jgi:hypothetical protein